MDDPVDILLATYNGQKLLPELLSSILQQTHKELRIISAMTAPLKAPVGC